MQEGGGDRYDLLPPFFIQIQLHGAELCQNRLRPVLIIGELVTRRGQVPDGGAFDPSTPPDYVSIEACQGTLLDDVEFDASVDITNVTIASGNLPSGLFSDFTP